MQRVAPAPCLKHLQQPLRAVRRGPGRRDPGRLRLGAHQRGRQGLVLRGLQGRARLVWVRASCRSKERVGERQRRACVAQKGDEAPARDRKRLCVRDRMQTWAR